MPQNTQDFRQLAQALGVTDPDQEYSFHDLQGPIREDSTRVFNTTTLAVQ
jgi:hypothetical protein